jgi:hypothetical protein
MNFVFQEHPLLNLNHGGASTVKCKMIKVQTRYHLAVRLMGRSYQYTLSSNLSLPRLS